MKKQILYHIETNARITDGLCQVDRNYIAETLGVSYRKVCYHIDEMAKIGQLKKEDGDIYLPMKENPSPPLNGQQLSPKDLQSMEARNNLIFNASQVFGGKPSTTEKPKKDKPQTHQKWRALFDPRVIFLVFIVAQTVHTFKAIYFVSGADAWSVAYALFTCVAVDSATYLFVVEGERYKVQSMMLFYILVNVYGFNVDLLQDMTLSGDLLWRVLESGRFWLSVVFSVYLPHLMVKISEYVWKKQRLNN